MDNLITWSCCTNCEPPDWTAYNALEIAGCVEYGKGTEAAIVERVDGEPADFFTLYGRLVDGGCEALHDFDLGEDEIAIISACEKLAGILGFPLMDYR